MAKKKGIDMGEYIPSDEEYKAFVWCIRNNIKIAPRARSESDWYLIIFINGKQFQSPLHYGKIDIWVQLYQFYLYYYNKENKVIEIAKAIEKEKAEYKPTKMLIQNELF